jgi:hypothetical protein
VHCKRPEKGHFDSPSLQIVCVPMCCVEVNFEAMELQLLAQALVEESVWIDSFRSPATMYYSNDSSAQKNLDSGISSISSIFRKDNIAGIHTTTSASRSEVGDEHNLELLSSAPEP